MSVFLPDMACVVILNYKAPTYPSWDIKMLTIEFTVKEPDGSIRADLQQLQVISGVKSQSNEEE